MTGCCLWLIESYRYSLKFVKNKPNAVSAFGLHLSAFLTMLGNEVKMLGLVSGGK